jgi:RNA-directed DNA polymerase
VDFLGFHLRKVESWRWRGHYYLQRWPSDRAMASIRAKIREVTDRRYVGLSMEMVVTNLNRVLRGWSAYCVPRGRARSVREEVRLVA